MPTSISETGRHVAPSIAASPVGPEAAIRRFAAEAGFDLVGFAAPDAVADAAAGLDRFLALGWHGDMDWLAAKADRRRHPNALWPEARSVIMVGLNYGPAADPLAALARPERGVVSVYAQGRDYHDVIKRRLKRIGRWLAERFGCAVKVFVDTAPVMEKPLAQAAGLGWQGKHTNLVSRELGSWLFLGCIFTTLDLKPDAPEPDRCGSCRRCLEVCPTDAFPAPYRLDARRCISYLTIEHKGHVPRPLRAAIGNRIYGCDDCLAVCPWNKFARRAHEQALHPRAALDGPLLADLAGLDDGAFRQRFAGTAVKRTGRDRFVRNVLIALGNSADPAAARAVVPRLDDPAAIVRAMAVWALARLAPPEDFIRLRTRHLSREPDPAVRREWAEPA